jgi:hypothetical protein
MVLGYLSIRHIILGVFISSKNILGDKNIDIYICTVRPGSILGVFLVLQVSNYFMNMPARLEYF